MMLVNTEPSTINATRFNPTLFLVSRSVSNFAAQSFIHHTQ
jgi:hypothetical protein